MTRMKRIYADTIYLKLFYIKKIRGNPFNPRHPRFIIIADTIYLKSFLHKKIRGNPFNQRHPRSIMTAKD